MYLMGVVGGLVKIKHIWIRCNKNATEVLLPLHMNKYAMERNIQEIIYEYASVNI